MVAAAPVQPRCTRVPSERGGELPRPRRRAPIEALGQRSRTCSRQAVAISLVLTLATLAAPARAATPAVRTPPLAPAEPEGDAPTQAEFDELLERVRRLEAERDARVQAPEPATPARPERGTSPEPTAGEAAQHPFVLGGYAEVFYQWNFRDPSNNLTNFRGFDNRHNTFTLANVALDAAWDHEGLIGRLTLQVGHTPSTYYASEPSSPGSSGANVSDAELWKYLQQAYAGYRFAVGGGLTLTAGLFLSPIGPESIAVRENWNWSRSNLFFGLPFYHAGVRASYAITPVWSVTLAGYNGWNSVVDNNDEKSVSVQVAHDGARVNASLLYFGGVERPRDAPEGRAWRHLLDAHVTWRATPWLALRAHVNGGIEPNEFGASRWAAAALYARFRVIDKLFIAARGDYFAEGVASSAAGAAAAVFWPAPWVSSGTATLDVRPHERVSLQLEYRHDHAGAAMYFGGSVVGDGIVFPYVLNRGAQDTLTLGATTWF